MVEWWWRDRDSGTGKLKVIGNWGALPFNSALKGCLLRVLVIDAVILVKDLEQGLDSSRYTSTPDFTSELETHKVPFCLESELSTHYSALPIHLPSIIHLLK